jgi:hypothetical protein
MVSLFVHVERVRKCGNIFTHTSLPYVLANIAFKLREISSQHNDQGLSYNTLNILANVRQLARINSSTDLFQILAIAKVNTNFLLKANVSRLCSD